MAKTGMVMEKLTIAVVAAAAAVLEREEMATGDAAVEIHATECVQMHTCSESSVLNPPC